MKCCNRQIYRKGMCRMCYKHYRLSRFHCTYGNCYKRVFSATLCQFHYRISHVGCLLCNGKLYCRTLCKKHYRERSTTGDFPPEPLCQYCTNKMYCQQLCLHHFKKKYDSKCIMIGCQQESFRRGLCCRHYFRHRRRIENKKRI